MQPGKEHRNRGVHYSLGAELISGGCCLRKRILPRHPHGVASRSERHAGVDGGASLGL
jgi:hypothetical protein